VRYVFGYLGSCCLDQLLDGSILLKFEWETRLESESFDPLIDFLTFLIQKLGYKTNKLISYLIMGLIKYFVIYRL